MSQRQSFTEFIKCLLVKQLLKSLDLFRESCEQQKILITNYKFERTAREESQSLEYNILYFIFYLFDCGSDDVQTFLNLFFISLIHCRSETTRTFILLHKTTETHTHTHTHTHTQKAAGFLYKRHQIRAGLPRAARRWGRWAPQQLGFVSHSTVKRSRTRVRFYPPAAAEATDTWENTSTPSTQRPSGEMRDGASDHVWPRISALCFSGTSWLVNVLKHTFNWLIQFKTDASLWPT